LSLEDDGYFFEDHRPAPQAVIESCEKQELGEEGYPARPGENPISSEAHI
jgi:hypothetical protein